MLKQTLFFSLIVSLAAIGTANAQEPRDFSQLPVQTLQLPGTDFEIVFNSPELQVGEPRPMRPLSVAIASWLTASVGLPKVHDLPRVEFASPTNIAMLRYKNPLLKGDFVGLEVTPTVRNETPAFYNDTLKIIYLPNGWNGSTPTELSVFIREMVHHMQNEAGFKYESMEARDELAIAAQNIWLAMFKSNVQQPNGTSAKGLVLSTQ